MMCSDTCGTDVKGPGRQTSTKQISIGATRHANTLPASDFCVHDEGLPPPQHTHHTPRPSRRRPTPPSLGITWSAGKIIEKQGSFARYPATRSPAVQTASESSEQQGEQRIPVLGARALYFESPKRRSCGARRRKSSWLATPRPLHPRFPVKRPVLCNISAMQNDVVSCSIGERLRCRLSICTRWCFSGSRGGQVDQMFESDRRVSVSMRC